ncbi:adenylate/guanylate cyclase domain-containing protein [Planosporangium flavigriseum]|uniref:adenylate/guanylate cyclase domain-containing protein n=1 Tax=Planosporangium flavigriseum TaxID=373681 RepID=UPI00143997FF|nr:adenylate/guanylate cyclase domain-containing protein [Planosporangium flavigriseum]NJC63622.1 adenylate/guanylate cyclase domain-containing protein [Planosporangium flavigriseum]
MSARMHLPDGQVTFLFTDIEGSTRLAQMLGVDYRSVLTEHRQVLRHTLSIGDGVELSTEGDSLFVAFADAAAALSACAAAQRALSAHEWPGDHARPMVRMGLHTGYAHPVAGEYASPEVHRAARVAAAAHGGQVLCSAATAAAAAGALPAGAALRDLGLYRLRGFDGRERLYQLVAPGLDRDFPRPRTVGGPPHNLPTPVGSFVGRVAEQEQLREVLSVQRLVTVVGAGGSGKTRVAVEVARGLVGDYPDGVWFVDLAEAGDAQSVASAVAQTLGLRPEPGRPVTQTIADQAADRRILLVLDTCDAHLPVAAAVVARLLGGGAGARILATSREPLGLPGEVVWRILPLPIGPAADGRPSDAVSLLLDRAAASRGGQLATDDELGYLDRVATAVAGLPLALELAAARLRVLSAGQLAARIDDVLSTLDAGSGGYSPDRHRSLRATLAWSYRTLDRPAARLLRRLSVFAGPVTLPAIEWLGGGDPLDALATLVDKSLIQVEQQPDAATYRMLDPIRAYAARELCDNGEEEVVRDRHVGWCLRQIRGAHADANGRAATLSLYTLDPLVDEVRGALRWTVTRGLAREGLAVTTSLDQWWRERGRAPEARLWLFRLYERIRATGERLTDAELAAAYRIHALLSAADGEYVEQLRFSQRSELAARRVGDVGLLARVLAGRGGALYGVGRTGDAERTCREVTGWARRESVPGDALGAVYTLARILMRRGALDEAADLLAHARPLEASRPAERGRRTVDMLLGLVALRRGDVVAAHDHLTVALRSRMGFGFHASACETLNAVAVRCLTGEDPLTAARLFGAAQTVRARLRLTVGPDGAYWHEQQAVARAVLGDVVFDAAYAEGATLTLTDAVAVALTVEHPDLVAGSDRFSHSS